MKYTICWTLILVCLLHFISAEAAELNTKLAIKPVHNGIEISWRAVEGCSEYTLYRSPCRFGEYSAVTASPLKTQTKFRDNAAQKYSYYKVGVKMDSGEIVFSQPHSLETELFGNNTLIISPNDSPLQVIKAIDDITKVLADGKVSQFTDRRQAILFKAGNYDWLGFENGFYMHIAGLGFSPEDTKLDRVSVNTNWLGGNNATCNFWRTLENVTLLNSTGNFNYGISQAAPLRRLKIHGKVSLDMGGWSSGGYLADSRVEGSMGSGSQQQFFLRNNSMNHFWGVNWNLVTMGNNATIADNPKSSFKRTIIEKSPIIYEKPFLFFENGDYHVFIPSVRKDVSGISWDQSRDVQGRSMDLSSFYVARADYDNDVTINNQLKQGKHILFTPGTYRVENPIIVNRPNMILLGLGLASIHPTHGKNAMEVADVEGVRIAGLIFDAGSGMNNTSDTGGSPILLQVGKRGANNDLSANPIVLSDLFFRVGGVKTELPCRADISLEINANSTIGDHFWIWRADHGDQVGWELNKADYGLVVNGDDVTIYGLFVEHYQKYDTFWKGENGRMYFYQNEKAYDVPTQQDWIGPDGNGNGWAAYRVADGVKKHQAWGVGVYSVFINTKGFVLLENAIVTPLQGDIEIHYPFTMLLSTDGGIEHIINGVGGPNTNRESTRGSNALLPKEYNHEWKSTKQD